MTDNDKENIKNAVLESIAKQNLNPVELAEQACKAIELINSYQEHRDKPDPQYQIQVFLTGF